MAGAPYEAGGIRGHHRGDAGGVRRRAARRSPARAGPRRSPPGSPTSRDQVRLRARRSSPRRASARLAAELTDDVTFLGAHLVPPEYEGRADEYVELVCGEMLDACAPHCTLDRRLLRARRLRRRAVARGARGRPRRRARPARPRQPARARAGRAARGRDGRRLGRPLHLPRRRRHRGARRRRETVATFLPATDFSTRQPYPDARRAIDAGVAVAIATNTNPGSSYTTSMPFCIALAVREHGDDDRRGAAGGDAWAARGRCAATTSATSRPAPAPTRSSSTRPRYAHLIYRPGRAADRGRVQSARSDLLNGQPISGTTAAPWTGAGLKPRSKSSAVTIAPAARMPAAHQNAVE